MRPLGDFILRFIVACLAVCGSMIPGVLIFWAIGGFLFHRGIIKNATLFVFPRYGVLPGFIAGGVWYAIIMIGKQTSR
jgi:hypothetical protein